MTVLLCPLCSQPRFSNLEALRLSLVNAATQSISCPICNDVLMGLDKLTIHLFGHTLNPNLETRPSLELKMIVEDPRPKSDAPQPCPPPPAPPPPPPPQPQPPQTTNFGAEYQEKLTGKFEESEKFFAEIESNYCPDGGQKLFHEESEARSDNLCTVNMEDLSFLTSWENNVKTKQDEKELDNQNQGMNRQENGDLSEYMSDLLNKKLPILNFTFALDNASKPVEETTQEIDRKQLKCGICSFTFPNPVILSMHEELVHSKAIRKKLDNGDGYGMEKLPQICEENPSQEKPEFFPEIPCVSRTSTDPETTPPPVNPLAVPDVVVSNGSAEEIETKETTLPRYDCHLCSKSFKMKGSLLLHFRVAHFGLGSSESLQILGDASSPEERNYSCPICNKTFKKEQHLTQHIKTHEGKQWQCKTCNKHFTTKYFLKKHQRLHTGEMPYSCVTCKKTFTFQQSYHKHLLYHSDEKPHQCLQCGRSFKELSTLHNHQRIHSGEKPFACETCGKCFRQRVSYIVHQRIHTGVLPYQCTACKKKFRYKVSQRSHKCTAQPPGIVIRQPDIVQKILENKHMLQQNHP